MADNIFGDLRDWGNVLALIDDLQKNQKLDEYQQELTRILRYKDNWKLRETALESIKELKRPSDELLAEVLNIMMDDNIYYNARILAADALSHLLRRRNREREQSFSITVDKVVEEMNTLLNSPQPPILHEAIRTSLLVIREE